MKKIFTIILIIATIHCQAQADYDSLKQKILKMDVAINTIHFNMVQSQNQYRVGTVLLVAGLIVTGMGIHIVSINTVDGDGNINQPYLMYGGLALTTAGTIIHIDSHKWIGRGGRKLK